MQTELLNLGLLLLLAIIGGILSAKFKQPLVIGLIIIGALAGPNLLGFINDPGLIELSIEFGAILSLFVLGMEFSLKKLQKIGLKSAIVALFKVGMMFSLGFVTIIMLGFDTLTAAFVGVALSFSSTLIIINVLQQKNWINRKEVPLLVGVLILEDIFGIIALTFFASSKTGNVLEVIKGLEHIAISLAILVVAYLLLSKFAERIMLWIKKATSEETTIFLALGLCAGFAYLAFILGLSPSAGAFLAGSVVSNFRESKSFEHAVKPHTYLFSAFLFISMGTMVDIQSIIRDIEVLAILALITFAGLFLSMGLISRVFANFNKQSSVFSSILMLPPGIFSMLVAKESLKFNIGIDLVGIISVLILIHTIILNILTARSDKLTRYVPSSNKSRIGMYIKGISIFFSNLFNEIEMESSYTRRLKKEFVSVSIKFISNLFVAIGISQLLMGLFNNIIDIIFTAPLSILFIYLSYISWIQMKHINTLLTRIVSNLEAGMHSRKIRRSIRRLLVGSFLILIGLYSPLIIFIFSLTTTYLIITTGIVLAGILMYILAAKALTPLTFNYKYSIHKYKKIKLKNNKYVHID